MTSQAEFAVRAEPDEFKGVGVRLSVEQHKIRPDVAIAMIFPLSHQGMIDMALRQRLIVGQQFKDRPEECFELRPEDT